MIFISIIKIEILLCALHPVSKPAIRYGKNDGEKEVKDRRYQEAGLLLRLFERYGTGASFFPGVVVLSSSRSA